MLYPEDKIFEDRNAKIDNQNKTNAVCKMLREVEDWDFKYIECPCNDGEDLPGQYIFARAAQDIIDSTAGEVGKTVKNPYIVGTLASMIYQYAESYKRNGSYRHWYDGAENKFDELDRFARRYIGPDSLTAETAEQELVEIRKLRSNHK